MASIPIEEPRPTPGRRSRSVLFATGFRPFFLLAAWFAAIALVVWLASWIGQVSFDPPAGIVRWHGHEMLFGFATAGLAGFILTAVPNWTGTRPLGGAPLALLVLIWLAGRVGMAGLLPLPYGAIADAAFLPALAVAVAPAILRRSVARNGVFVLVLLVLAMVNAAFHADFARFDADRALRLAIGLFAILIGLVGGRIVPAFTQSGLRVSGRAVTIVARPRLDRAAVLVLVLAVAADAAGLPPAVCGAAAGIAAVLHALRLSHWQGWSAHRLPLVWILHAGYLWLVIGMALLAASHLGLVDDSAHLHAWGAGAVGTMLLAVMSRASLGHAGRDLVADAATVVAYGLVTVGAALRVAAAVAAGPAYGDWVLAGGAAWSLGYLVFAVRFLPVWLRPRQDGRPG